MQWPTNARLFHKLSHSYMFRHYRVILKQLVINTLPKCNVLLTVHHAKILGNCPNWRTNSFQCIYLFIYRSLHVSSMSCSSSGETNFVNTTSGNCHFVLVAVSCAAINTEWQLPEAVLIQFVSPDDEHDMLETWREL